MQLKYLGFAAAFAVAGCCGTPEATRVVNQSGSTLHVTYIVKGTDTPRTVHIAAGEAKLLGAGHGPGSYASVQFRDAAQNVIFRDGDSNWQDSRCTGDCEFVWFGNGRVAITA